MTQATRAQLREAVTEALAIEQQAQEATRALDAKRRAANFSWERQLHRIEMDAVVADAAERMADVLRKAVDA